MYLSLMLPCAGGEKFSTSVDSCPNWRGKNTHNGKQVYTKDALHMAEKNEEISVGNYYKALSSKSNDQTEYESATKNDSI